MDWGSGAGRRPLAGDSPPALRDPMLRRVDTDPDTRAAAERAAAVILDRAGRRPQVGLICGTGFAACTDILADRVTIGFEELGFRASAIPDHVNEVDVGTLDGIVVAAVKAKSLPCDGATWQEAGLPGAHAGVAGCETLLYSAHSGSMRDDLPPGSFMAFSDHINFSGINPLSTEREGGPWGTPYLSMAELYDPDLTRRLCAASAGAGIPMPTGVAGYWMGPSFETPAEIGLARAGGLRDLLELVPARGDGGVSRRPSRRGLHVRLDLVRGDGPAHRPRSGDRRGPPPPRRLPGHRSSGQSRLLAGTGAGIGGPT